MRIGFVDRVKKIYEKFVSLILLILLLILSLSLFRSISKTKQNALLIKKERDRVEALSKEKQRLEEELQKVHSEEYIEKQLRDTLGLAKDGEIVLILPDEEVVKKFAPEYDEEEETLPDPNWKKWAKMFL